MMEVIINSEVVEVFQEFVRRIRNEIDMYPQHWLANSNYVEVEDGE